VEPVLKITTTVAEQSLAARRAEARFRIHMAWIAVLVIVFIVGVSTYLTYNGKE